MIPLATWGGARLFLGPARGPPRHPAQSRAAPGIIVAKMARSTDGDGILAVLHGASVLGIHLADAADVYSWGLTREFAEIRAACGAHIAAAVSPRADRRPVMSSRSPLRKVMGDDR